MEKQGKATVARPRRYSKRFLAELWRDIDALGITGLDIASKASTLSPRGSVKPPTVYNVRAGRRNSAVVIEAAVALRGQKQAVA